MNHEQTSIAMPVSTSVSNPSSSSRTMHPMRFIDGGIEACIKCRGKHHSLCRPGIFESSMWMVPCHSGQACRPIADRCNVKKSKTDRQAQAIWSVKPFTKAFSDLVFEGDFDTGSFYKHWVLPIKGIPPEYTYLGASGMDMEDVDRIVAEAEAKDAAAAEERSAKRTAKRDAELAKLEASAEAYLSVNVPTIPTLSRLQDLEELYGLEHALPRRPFPPHRKLPLRRVLSVWFVDRMKLFHENVAKLA
jgi:hypothetical protein